MFEERLNRSMFDATLYMEQFKNESVVITARYVVSGTNLLFLLDSSLLSAEVLRLF